MNSKSEVGFDHQGNLQKFPKNPHTSPKNQIFHFPMSAATPLGPKLAVKQIQSTPLNVYKAVVHVLIVQKAKGTRDLPI